MRPAYKRRPGAPSIGLRPNAAAGGAVGEARGQDAERMIMNIGTQIHRAIAARHGLEGKPRATRARHRQ